MSLAAQKCGIRVHRPTSLTILTRLGALWLTLSIGVACGPGIGDSCSSSLRCSASGTRLCDMTQPGGYCTLAACQVGNCPSESVCVTFWQNTETSEADRNRLSVNYCMRKCEDDSDCRDDEGYACVSGMSFGLDGEATVEGDEQQRFCAVAQSM